MASAASAQQGPIDATVIHLGQPGTVCRGTAGGPPAGPTTCDWYHDATTGRIFMRWSTGTWVGVTVSGDSPTFAALTVDSLSVLGSASVVEAMSAAWRQRLYGRTRYGSDWFVGYDGATWLTAFDTTGNVFMPLVLRGSTVRFLAPTRTQGTATFDAAIVAGGNVGTANYVSQTTGWQVDPGGALDVRFLYTDELRAKIFTAVLEQVLAGVHTVSKSVALLSHPFTCPSAGGSATLSVEDLPGAPDMAVFESGDWVVIREFSRASGSLTIGDCAGQVTSPSTSPDVYQTWTFTRGIGANGGTVTGGTVLGEGGAAIDFGVSGNGVYRVSAVDGAYGANSPYAAVETWTTAPTSGNFVRRATFGNLKGVTGVTGEFGFLAGVYSTTTPYVRASTEGVELNNATLALRQGGTKTFSIDPSGPFWAMGNPLPTGYGTGTGCWAGLDGGVYKWRCGTPGGQGIFWNNETLNITGNITVEGFVAEDTNNVDGIPASEVASNAARAGLGLSSSGGVLLPVAAAPSGCGLFLGSDKLGFYCASAWRAYLDNEGNFALGSKLAFDYDAGTLSVDGTITSVDGVIGGWSIAPTSLTSGAGSTTVGLDSGGSNPAIYAGSSTPGSAPFRVEASGAMVASNATVTGTVTATDGLFGGVWSVASNRIIYDTGTDGTSAGLAPLDYPFYAGATYANRASAPFRVTPAGAIVASNATVEGHIVATSGSFAGDGSALTDINGGYIQTGSISSAQLAADSVTADKIAVVSLSAISAVLGQVTINDDLTMSTGRIVGSQYVLQQDGLEFENSSDAEASVRWEGGAEVNGGDSRLRLRGPGGTFSQINLNTGFIGFWAGISGDGPQHMFIDGNGIGTEAGVRLGQDGYEFSELWVTIPSTTSNEYPVVWLSNGSFRHKTNGWDGWLGCSTVADIQLESGIVVGASCADNDVAALRREVTELRNQLESLLRGQRREDSW